MSITDLGSTINEQEGTDNNVMARVGNLANEFKLWMITKQLGH